MRMVIYFQDSNVDEEKWILKAQWKSQPSKPAPQRDPFWTRQRSRWSPRRKRRRDHVCWTVGYIKHFRLEIYKKILKGRASCQLADRDQRQFIVDQRNWPRRSPNISNNHKIRSVGSQLVGYLRGFSGNCGKLAFLKMSWNLCSYITICDNI